MTMNSAVSPPSPSSISQKRLDATRQARFRSPFSSSSLKTGTNADESAASATSARIEVRHLEGDREGVDLAGRSEVVRGDDLADEAEDAREAGGEREDRRRPARAGCAWPAAPRAEYREGLGRFLTPVGAALRREIGTRRVRFRDYDRRWVVGSGCPMRRRARRKSRAALLPSLPPAAPRAFSSDAEHQTAEEARPHRRRASGSRTSASARPSKTLARRLQAAVEEGDDDRVAEEHQQLVALARPRRGARRDAQEHGRAAEVAGRPARLPQPPSRLRAQRAGSRRSRRAPARARARRTAGFRPSVPGRARRAGRSRPPARPPRSSRLGERLLGGERMQLQPRRGIPRA